MKFLTLLCALSALVPTILAGPTGIAVTIDAYPGEKTGKHIVTLKDGVSAASILSKVSALLAGKPGTGITHEYNTVFNGFAGSFDKETLTALRLMPGVDSIAEDGIVYATVTQSDAPWGLARLSSRDKPAKSDNDLSYTYDFDERSGKGVDIYVIDTGVRTTHEDFGDRASWGFAAPTYGQADGNGHGTHCAGTAIGGQYGVAKQANVIAVKVLSDSGSGSIADVISGMGYALVASRLSGRPSVVSMSLGGGASSPLDLAARALVEAGVHVVVAAGNDGEDAEGTSPARVPEVITVGASTIDDERAWFSNFGSSVDVFAPGLDVTSAWIDSDEANKTISGTSMATPHVAGLVAYFLSIYGQMTPAEMANLIKEFALNDILTDIPSGTANVLVHNGFIATV